jgi:hypothetical protein
MEQCPFPRVNRMPNFAKSPRVPAPQPSPLHHGTVRPQLVSQWPKAGVGRDDGTAMRDAGERIAPTGVANFSLRRLSRGQRDGSLRPYSLISRPEPLLFLPSSSTVELRRLSGPRSRRTISQEIW